MKICVSFGKRRKDSYEAMIERALKLVREGLNVTVVFYGHPGVFCYPAHEAIRHAKNEGHLAVMHPAISSEDCLIADLGIDPGKYGCQSFECTDFLVYKRKFDPSSSLILWQIGVIGDLTFPYTAMQKEDYNKRGLHVLMEYLMQFYSKDHEVIVYTASVYPICDPSIQYSQLSKLHETRINAISTLYVPPFTTSQIDTDMIHKLGMSNNLQC